MTVFINTIICGIKGHIWKMDAEGCIRCGLPYNGEYTPEYLADHPDLAAKFSGMEDE